MGEPIGEGEAVVLLAPGRDPLMLRAGRGPQAIRGEGVIDLTSAIGRPEGFEVLWAGRPCRVVRPSLSDRLAQVRRKAQIIVPKDAAPIVFHTGISAGSRVAEAGAGSGALTVVLAHFVGPLGRVHTFDRREDFLDVARTNVAAAGLADRVTFAVRDVATEGLGLEGLDAVVLDLPEPWAVAPAARDSLKIGGSIAAFSPTYNQLERTVRALRDAGFGEVRALEVLERSLHVGEGGTRPEFEMLGHTGFLAFGRREG